VFLDYWLLRGLDFFCYHWIFPQNNRVGRYPYSLRNNIVISGTLFALHDTRRFNVNYSDVAVNGLLKVGA